VVLYYIAPRYYFEGGRGRLIIIIRVNFRYFEQPCDFSVESLPTAKRYPFPDFSRAKSPIGVAGCPQTTSFLGGSYRTLQRMPEARLEATHQAMSLSLKVKAKE